MEAYRQEFSAGSPGPGVLVEQTLTGDLRPPRVGRFWFYFDIEGWEWPPEVTAIYSYPPTTMTTGVHTNIPTTHLLLTHTGESAPIPRWTASPTRPLTRPKRTTP